MRVATRRMSFPLLSKGPGAATTRPLKSGLVQVWSTGPICSQNVPPHFFRKRRNPATRRSGRVVECTALEIQREQSHLIQFKPIKLSLLGLWSQRALFLFSSNRTQLSGTLVPEMVRLLWCRKISSLMACRGQVAGKKGASDICRIERQRDNIVSLLGISSVAGVFPDCFQKSPRPFERRRSRRVLC